MIYSPCYDSCAQWNLLLLFHFTNMVRKSLISSSVVENKKIRRRKTLRIRLESGNTDEIFMIYWLSVNMSCPKIWTRWMPRRVTHKYISRNSFTNVVFVIFMEMPFFLIRVINLNVRIGKRSLWSFILETLHYPEQFYSIFFL